jgi:hypothetical protein
MSRFDDDVDVEVDELLAGRTVPGHEPLALVLGLVRAQADEPAPAPSPALASVLRDGLPAAALDSPVHAAGARARVLRGMRWAAGLGVAGKILLGAGIAAAAVAGTATLPVVPDSVQTPVRAALTDLGHLIPGAAGGSVPVPTTTTPEPVDGAVSSEDHPPAVPEPRGTDSDPLRHSDDFVALRPVPTDAPGRRGVESGGGESAGSDANRRERSPEASPAAHPSASATQDAQSSDRGRPSSSPTTPASDGSTASPQGGQGGD